MRKKLILLNLDKKNDINILKDALSSEYASEALLSDQIINKVRLAFVQLDNTYTTTGVGGLYSYRYFFYDLFISLHESERGKGLGGKLLDSIIDHSARSNLSVFLQTHKIEKYSRAIALYESRNFKLIGKYQNKILMCSANAKILLVVIRVSFFYIENFIKYRILGKR